MDCQDWLLKYLRCCGGFSNVDTTRRAAEAAGFSRRELKQARRNLGVKAYHQFEDESKEPLNWFWYLEE